MKHWLMISIILTIVLICTALTLMAHFRTDGSVAEISVNGEIIHKIRLDSVKDAYEIPIDQNGHINTVLVENGKISMKSADCPDKLCVSQGAISNSSYPIVCLPNKVIIRIKGDFSSNDTPDAISK